MGKFKVGDKVRIKDGVVGYLQESYDTIFIYGEDQQWDYTFHEHPDDFELVEENKQRHVHYDLIVKWAANPSEAVVEYFDNVEMCWKYIEKPAWVSSCQYRFKPEESERVFPTTSLTDDELHELYMNNSPHDNALESIANTAIKRYILEQEDSK